jgi:hypothetical protein
MAVAVVPNRPSFLAVTDVAPDCHPRNIACDLCHVAED